MTLLLKSHKAALVDKMVAAGRAAHTADEKRRENSLALRVTKQRYGDDVFERCRALPRGWLNVHKTIHFGYTTHPEGLPNKTIMIARYPVSVIRQHELNLSDAVVLPNSFAEHWTRKHLGDLYNEIHQHFTAIIERYEEEENLRTQITGVLTGFKTIEKLAERWPEAYAYFPHELLNVTIGPLPAPRLEDLNRRLDAFRKVAA